MGNTFPPNDLLKEKYSSIRKVVPLLPEWFIMKQFRDDLSTRVTPFSENSPLVYAYLAEQYHGEMSKSQFVGRIEVVLGEFERDYSVSQKNIPKLIIESDNDPLIPPDLQKELRTIYPNAQVFTFKDKGHFPYLNEAGKYTDVLHSFLMDETEKAIQSTIQNYFDGRKEGDLALLKKAFHPNAKLKTTTTTGESLTILLKDYFVAVQKDGPVNCTTQLLSLTYEDTVATATTSFDYGDKTYVDTLSISNIDGLWQIVNKAFSKIK